MYTFIHREPAFPGTSARQAYERAVKLLNSHGGLDGYEYVADRQVLVLEPGDTRDIRALARESEMARSGLLSADNGGTHVARKIEGGWEFALIIRGD